MSFADTFVKLKSCADTFVSNLIFVKLSPATSYLIFVKFKLATSYLIFVKLRLRASYSTFVKLRLAGASAVVVVDSANAGAWGSVAANSVRDSRDSIIGNS